MNFSFWSSSFENKKFIPSPFPFLAINGKGRETVKKRFVREEEALVFLFFFWRERPEWEKFHS